VKNGPRIYNLFPALIGPIDRWSEHLSRIAAMRFNWVYVNPFHAPGCSGSLYAIKDYYRLNPFFRGSSRDSDDELLRRFVDAAHAVGIGVMMDLVINHTAKDAALVTDRPQWYVHDHDGAVSSPFAVDPADASKRTVWHDLAELDWSERPEREALVTFFSDVVTHYVNLGFDGFRCDAAYKVPGTVWKRLIGRADAIRPNVLFAAETLGCRPDEVHQLGGAGFDFLFNSAKWWDFRSDWLLDQYEQFRHIAPSIAFPESHDTPRLISELAAGKDPEAAYRLRYLFSAFFSSGVMMPVGYEFGFSRPLNVVTTRPDDWETPRFDLSGFVSEVNAMKSRIPALNDEGLERRLTTGHASALALVRYASRGRNYAIALINPDRNAPAEVEVGATPTVGNVRLPADVTPGADGALQYSNGKLRLRPLELRVFAVAADRDRA
jgi:starch synthase (maltosyl-transferring)